MGRIITGLGVVLASAFLLAVPASAGAAEAGVQAHLLWDDVSTADMERQLDAVRASGAKYVRVDVGWSSIESKRKGEFNAWYLERVDRIVAAAEQRGLKLIFTFWETPCWASTAPESLKQGCEGSWWNRGVQRYAPRDPSDYADALSFVIRRYGDRVAAWEVWNEPNHADFLKGGDQVEDYARILKAAYPAAKRADPGATILGGSLANSDFEFTKDLFAEGVKNHFDGWSIHPYSEDRSPLDPWRDQYMKNSFIRGIPAVRDVLVRNGDAEPLWLTEFGWSTCNVRNQPEAWRNCVSESKQGEWLGLAFDQMQRWSYVKAGIWFNLQDNSSDASDKVDNFGLLRYNGSRKPAYRALQLWSLGGNPVAPADQSRALTLRAFARNSGIRARGGTVASKEVTLRAYRYRRSKERFAGSPRHKRTVHSDGSGRYSGRFAGRKLDPGKWKITATARFGGESLTRKDVVRWRD